MYHVLACGESFQGLEFEERDRAREDLRLKVARQAGISFVLHYWIWDETERAQLWIDSKADREEAEKIRDYLQRHGIQARITTSLPRM